MEICYNIGRGKFQPFHLEQSDEAIAATHAEHAKQVCGQNRGICPKPLASLVNCQVVCKVVYVTPKIALRSDYNSPIFPSICKISTLSL